MGRKQQLQQLQQPPVNLPQPLSVRRVDGNYLFYLDYLFTVFPPRRQGALPMDGGFDV
jgi:hypothetical protein